MHLHEEVLRFGREGHGTKHLLLQFPLFLGFLGIGSPLSFAESVRLRTKVGFEVSAVPSAERRQRQSNASRRLGEHPGLLL